MVTFFLIRHGQTDWNVLERFQGHTDIPLNEKGREQARMLVPHMREKSIQAILSSDLSRAVETAEIIARELNVPVIQDARLREAHLGEAQGMTRDEMIQKFGKELTARWRSSVISDADVSYPGGETGAAVIERSFGAIENFILQNSHYTRFAVATHGGVIRRLVQRLLPQDSPPVAIPNGVVYALNYLKAEKRFAL